MIGTLGGIPGRPAKRVPYRFGDVGRALVPPAGKPLLIHIVVNVEYWPLEMPMPRQILPAPHRAEPIPDIPNFSWAEYGMRCGLPRIIRVLGSRGIRASASFNASVIEAYPEAAAALVEAGWEFIGHGLHQQSLQAAKDELAVVQASLDKIEAFTGARPRGWLSPGLHETLNTPDILVLAGIEYVCDWAIDDLPNWMDTTHGRLVAMPYTLELNDTIIYAVQQHSSIELYQRVVDTLAALQSETVYAPRVVTLALHPHLMGVPHRIPYLERALDLLAMRSDTVFMTGSEILDWFKSAVQ